LDGLTDATAVAPVVSAVTTAVAPVVAAVTAAVAPVVSAVTTAVAPAVSAVTTAVAPVVAAVTTAVAPVVSAVTTAVAPVVSAVTNPSAGTPPGSPLGVSQRSSTEPSSQAAVGPPTGSERSAALPGPGGLEVGLASLAASASGARNQSEGTTVGWSGAANGLLPGAPSSPLRPLPVPPPGPRLAGCSSSAGLTGSTQLFSRVAAASTLDALGWRRTPHDRAGYRSFRFLFTLDRPG
jgi:hypothetical protein